MFLSHADSVTHFLFLIRLQWQKSPRVSRLDEQLVFFVFFLFFFLLYLKLLCFEVTIVWRSLGSVKCDSFIVGTSSFSLFYLCCSVSKAVPADQWSERLHSASTVTALGPDSHSLLSVGFIYLTRRTMNENYDSSCTNVHTSSGLKKWVLLIFFTISHVTQHMYIREGQ